MAGIKVIGGDITSAGTIQAIGGQTFQRHKQKEITQNGGTPPQTWPNPRGGPGGGAFSKSE